jgi:Flp pilus assembly protein TadD
VSLARHAPSLALVTAILTAACAKRVPAIHPEAVHHSEQCALRMQGGHLAEAQEHCEHALGFSPHYTPALVNLGLVLMRRDQPAAARDAFLRALEQNESLPAAHNSLGVLALEARDFQEAEKRFKRALDHDRDSVVARYNLALTYYLARRNDRAREELERLIRARPELIDPLHFHAILVLEAGQVEEATLALIKCVTLDPRIPGYWLALGVAFARANRYVDAEKALRTCLMLDPDDGVCRSDLSALLRRERLPPPPVESPKL